MKRNRFMLTLSYESIIKLLGLPNDYELLSIAQLEAEKAMEKFSIIVAGEAGFKIPEGTPIPFLTIMELKERIERIEPVKLWWNGKHVATCLQGADEDAVCRAFATFLEQFDTKTQIQEEVSDV